MNDLTSPEMKFIQGITRALNDKVAQINHSSMISAFDNISHAEIFKSHIQIYAFKAEVRPSVNSTLTYDKITSTR